MLEFIPCSYAFCPQLRVNLRWCLLIYYFSTFSSLRCFFIVWALNTFNPLDTQIRHSCIYEQNLIKLKEFSIFLSTYFNARIYLNHRVNQEIAFILFFRRITHCLFPLTSHFLNNYSSMKNLGVITFLLTYRSRDYTCEKRELLKMLCILFNFG